MKSNRPAPRRRDETREFRLLLTALREAQGWTQDTLANTLGVSKKTLSNWEQGYWLPPFKQRLHVVLSLRNAPPEYVLGIADALGVSVDPAVAPFLQPFEDALDGNDAAASPAPAPLPAPSPPPLPRPSPEQLRGVADAVVREAADTLDARPNDVRSAMSKLLSACAALGATLEDAQRAVATPSPAPAAAG